MAKRIKSGLKRRRQGEVRRMRNRAVRTRVRNAIKELRTAISGGDVAKVQTLLPETVSAIDVGVRKGVLHSNLASRAKSRLMVQAGTVLHPKLA
jgi:small subunit ribosomal protein S20